ncbi:unnamed protein product (macronuclear) [Paramecium tetraurelia]|uniref:FHA domain-containing protein n=1 Tax=Paramecium tetraurelia TaxID=5888 RepID=A0E8F6_PARTE|nr:uncharacterized protein GSPATT00024302001 [Paramecium tetraurelia]CAK91573.1 unnamed protein product [Paramecium tetraurelia]|eukprot:XP_001458970.1 hypothetical protein (macronuclear) [Paramecium tetraurelia strain d4-2]
MRNFDEENEIDLIEEDIPIVNEPIFQWISFGDEQYHYNFLDDISMLRHDSIYFEEEDNSRLFRVPRIQLGLSSSREKPQNIQKYLQKRTIPIQNQQFDLRLPHIKVTQLRNMNICHEYFINEFGLQDSQKNTNSVDILIGRLFRQNKDIIPIDIVLPEDRVISRIHCKIVCNDYFRKDQKLDPLHAKVLKLIQIPSIIKFRISQFLEKPKIVQIQDLGSICGTYLRILKQKPCLLQKDQKFSVGSATWFNIVFNHTYDSKLKQRDPEWFSIIKHLISLKQSQKHEIHMNENQPLPFEPLDSIKNLTVSDLYKKLSEYQIPILVVKLQGQGVDNNKSLNLFIGNTETDTTDFFVGRGAENNIKINSNTISRKQCRIKYSQKYPGWIINDGLEDRESANGTWINLQTAEQSEKKIESNLIQIQHNDEIKISDFILKVELFKGTKQGNGHIINQFLHD